MPLGDLPRWLAVVPPLLLLTVLAVAVHIAADVREMRNTLDTMHAQLVDIDEDIHEVGGHEEEDEASEYR